MSRLRTGAAVVAIALLGAIGFFRLRDTAVGWGWVALGVAAVCAVILARVDVKRERSGWWRQPSAVAILPFVVAALAAGAILSGAEEAIAKVAASEKSWLAASAISSTAQLRAIGMYASAVLLLELAAAFGLTALATPPLRAATIVPTVAALAGALFAFSRGVKIDALDGALLAALPSDVAPSLLVERMHQAALWQNLQGGALAILILAVGAQFLAPKSERSLVTAMIMLLLSAIDSSEADSARELANSVGVSQIAEDFAFAPAPRRDEGGRFDGTIGRADLENEGRGLDRFRARPQPRRGLALDRRLTRLGVEQTIDALMWSGAREIDLFGESHAAPEASIEELGADGVFFTVLAKRRSAVRIALQRDVDPGALRADVTGGPVLALSSRVEAFDLSTTATAAVADGSKRRVFVRLREPAGVIELMRAAETLSLNGFQAVVAKEEKYGADPVSEIVEANLGRFIRCYRPRLQEKPNLTGKAVIRFDVQPGGAVLHASVASSDMADPPLEKCLAEEMKTLHFPNPKGDLLSVEYPFFFD